MRKPSIDLPDQMPEKRRTALVEGQRVGVEEITVELEVVTPILGGGTKTRDVDSVDIIRVPTIRGHLRFWWRALYGQNYDSPRELYAAEKRLWGGTTDDRDDGGGGRSLVDVAVRVSGEGSLCTDKELKVPQDEMYAMWPAREEKKGRDITKPAAPYREAGTRFTLAITCPTGADRQTNGTYQDQVLGALKAWILFGGYGSRTRRGLGSLRVLGADADRWLPRPDLDLRAELARLFGKDVFALPAQVPERSDLPLLMGAELLVGPNATPHDKAWARSIGWLRVFRQGVGPDEDDARTPGQRPRPGASRWPEADKVRQLSGDPDRWAHYPQHNSAMAWPRAGFGLPINARFAPPSGYGTEPSEFELRWRDRHEHDRLASPLIVKALPLADGTARACALWLYRGYPANSVVTLRESDRRARDSGAPFDLLEAPGDTARFAPLRDYGLPTGHNLRDAFFRWLEDRGEASIVIRGA